MRILLVEDDALLGDGLRAGLRQRGFQVDWVRDGMAAARELRCEPYAAAVLDLGLPQKDGLQVLAEARGAGVVIPVLVLTARDAVPDRVRGLDAGADDYVVKPVDLEELAARLRALVRRAHGQPRELLTVRDVTLESLRDKIGIVLQDTTLFSGSIRDNIAYGRPDAADAEVEAAARAAQAHEFITSFPDGYATIVGERGVGLSGGQRQRIAIARALLHDPRILILDDSTSAVDAETEFQIQRALDLLMAGRTSFVIAQRISTVRNADVILLLDAGKIVAQGKHDDLLRESPLYGEIIDSQFGGDRAAEPLIVAA